MALSIDISQVGSSLTAVLNGTELEGSASSESFVLTRHYVIPSCPTYRSSYDDAIICNESITFSGWLDPNGGLRGTIEHHQDGWNGAYKRYSWTASFELADVVRRPFVIP